MLLGKIIFNRNETAVLQEVVGQHRSCSSSSHTEAC